MRSQLNTQALLEISRLLEPAQARALECMRGMMSPYLTEAGFAAGVEEIAKINAMVEPHIEAIAAATPNGPETLRQVFGPQQDGSLSQYFWFHTDRPADYVANVARYGSFNQHYWASQGWVHWDKPAAEQAKKPSSAPRL